MVEFADIRRLSMQTLAIPISAAALASFCRQHGIAKLSLFGSILTENFTDSSDVDFLVDFLPGRTPGLITLMGYAMELERLIGRRVDLRTPADLHPDFRNETVARAETLYVA